MSLSDPIGDMIARVKNAQARNHKKVDLPSSNFKTKIADILKNEGFIKDFKVSNEDKKVILSEFIKENPNTKKKIQDIQSKKLQRAGAVIAVLSTPVEHPSIPEWEMQLSSGAVCMNLLSCAQSLGYAAQWLTEWYAYNDRMLEYFGGTKNKDKIAGFIYIGQKIDEPIERKRPDPYEVVTFL